MADITALSHVTARGGLSPVLLLDGPELLQHLHLSVPEVGRHVLVFMVSSLCNYIRFFLLAGAVGDGLDEHPLVVALLPVQDVAHGLSHTALAVNVELGEGVIHGIGQADDPRDSLVIAPAPVDGGEIDAGDPVNGLGQHEHSGNTDHATVARLPISGEKTNIFDDLKIFQKKINAVNK